MTPCWSLFDNHMQVIEQIRYVCWQTFYRSISVSKSAIIIGRIYLSLSVEILFSSSIHLGTENTDRCYTYQTLRPNKPLLSCPSQSQETALFYYNYVLIIASMGIIAF